MGVKMIPYTFGPSINSFGQVLLGKNLVLGDFVTGPIFIKSNLSPCLPVHRVSSSSFPTRRVFIAFCTVWGINLVQVF
jgi:hypothetical protein